MYMYMYDIVPYVYVCSVPKSIGQSTFYPRPYMHLMKSFLAAITEF